MRRLLPLAEDDDDHADVDIESAYAVPDGDHLRALFIASADGAAVAEGKSGPLANDTDRSLLPALRRITDAIVVGAGTVRVEGYGGIRLDDDTRLRRREAGRNDSPPLVIISGSADFDPGASVFVDSLAPPILVTTERGAEGPGRDLEGLADLMVVGSDRVDLRAALDALRERGLHQLLCEGGPALLSQLVQADLVDELCLTYSPTIVAGEAFRILRGIDEFEPPRALRLAHLFADDEGYLFARYALH